MEILVLINSVTLIPLSKARLKKGLISELDESKFLCCSKDILKGSNYCGQCGTKLK